MKEQREEDLETWILEWFQRKQIVQEEQAVARRYFLREFDQLQADDCVDVLRERLTIMDPDSPDLGPYGEWVESQAGASLICYQRAMDEGHGSPYSEVYGFLAGSDGYATKRASTEAYQTINQGSISGPESPGYHDSYQACIFQGKDSGFARRCADHLIEEFSSFEEAFQAAAEFEKAYQLMVKRGHTDLRARMYAEALRDYSQDFSEIYAKCGENEVAAGRSQVEAERFADIHASIILDDGEPDEDDPDGWRCELWSRTKAEAAYRYRTEFGDKEKFIDAFDQIHQTRCEDSESGSKEWFDEIEVQTLQQIAAQNAYIAEHGNLRGFKDQEERKPPIEPAPPKPPDFRSMSEEEFSAFNSGTEEVREAWEAEAEYRAWCDDEGLDPSDGDSRDAYSEQEGDSWDDMDDNDRDGWTDNMNKD